MNVLIEKYQTLETQYQTFFEQENQKGNTVAGIRLAVAVAFFVAVYYFFNAQNWVALSVVGFGLFILFLVLVVVHNKIQAKTKHFELLKKVNTNEIAYLNGDLSPFNSGDEFIDTDHPYSADLDFFGSKSIFQHLDRTTTIIGRNELANAIQNPNVSDILAVQKAVKELSDLVDWRQKFMAAGMTYVGDDVNKNFNIWLKRPPQYLPKIGLKILSFVLPACAVVAFGLYLFTDWIHAFTLLKIFGIANLLIVAAQMKHIKEEHQLLANVHTSLQKYSYLLQIIENQLFTSDKLIELKNSISSDKTLASKAIKNLSQILSQFDAIYNPFAAFISNGLFQYHIHALFNLEKWRADFGSNVPEWFNAIAEFEALASMGNFAHNNPDFVFPLPNTEGVLAMKNVGHPLIPKAKRITNDVVFKDTKFIVLTGSNMSGKSTFLRTLGVNLVMAKMGLPVCATEFSFYPINVFVSMRVSDSLQNDESFFFAELKRLQQIIAELDKNNQTFVILDEILRGTNSNDKRAGTIGLIKNLMAKQAVGIIATHDLVIGDMEKEFPNYLKNKCFEVEIINEELNFDYKLKDGVCQQMSAAFLMNKMGIIV